MSSLLIGCVTFLAVTFVIKEMTLKQSGVYIKSNIDGMEYRVQDKPGKEATADALAKIVVKMNTLIYKLNERKEAFGEYKKGIERLQKRFNPKAIAESPSESKLTSYTVNKGESMSFCIRTRDERNSLHDENMLTFVAIHELAHVASESEGHDQPEFKNNFKFLLEQAIALGLYNYEDYRNSPRMYCGTLVNTSPL